MSTNIEQGKRYVKPKVINSFHTISEARPNLGVHYTTFLGLPIRRMDDKDSGIKKGTTNKKKSEKKPNGYYDDIEVVISDLRVWMDSHDGRFPTRNDFEEAGNFSLVAGIIKHGGFPALRERMGVPLIRKSHGHYDDIEVVVSELRAWMDSHDGRFPTNNDLKESEGNVSLVLGARKHGGLPALRERMGVDLVQKPAGYYDDIEVVVSELRAWMDSHDGRFPTNNDLLSEENSSLVAGIKKHGGFPALRERMGVPLIRKSHGHYDDIEVVVSELRAWMDSHDGRFPTQSDLKESEGNFSLVLGARKHGGLPALRERMGVDLVQKPAGYYDDIEVVISDLRVWMDSHDGKFPIYNDLEKEGNSSLSNGARKHGGLPALRERMGVPLIRKSHGHYDDIEVVVSELRAWMDSHDGKFPTYNDFEKEGIFSLYYGIKKHGGLIYIGELIKNQHMGRVEDTDILEYLDIEE